MTEEGPSGDYRTTMQRDHHGRWIPIKGERAMTTEKGKGGKTKLLRRGSTEQEAFSIASAEASPLHGEFYLSRRNADEVSWKQLSKEQGQEAETASASTDDGADPDAAMKKTIKAADRSTEKGVSVRRENIWKLQKKKPRWGQRELAQDL